ncbi:hypothetical protein [Saccharibacillus kuerlensis]|uniref:Uncharacterized protein n=1 Tax=Saccharibacillus kuerlensis TaxID=459527 RepID=A0ABQ2KVN6_9BACL|nr:hypothetical protein [Saccharibacillus kuerlensis]GGN94171.1 hypothetical protein GCM10010969_08650 [Saccharibacillus kuerlensis]
MEKTRLGVSVGMLAAAVYFLGMISTLALVIAAGYVLLYERNEWLKKSAIKASVVTIAFALLGMIVPLGSSILGVLAGLAGWFGDSVFIGWPLGLNSILSGVLSIAQIVVLGILGFRALRQQELKLSKIDSLIERHAA